LTVGRALRRISVVVKGPEKGPLVIVGCGQVGNDILISDCFELRPGFSSLGRQDDAARGDSDRTAAADEYPPTGRE